MSYKINQELCSCCHRCRVECPVHAIRFLGAKYWIDPDKCISCGHCATVCHNDVISDPENNVTAEPHPKQELDCEVLVIGAGASGLAAAAKAAESGKRVLVIEKNKEIGGSAWYAHVFRSHWSVWHREARLSDQREELCQEFMEKTGRTVDEALLRRILKANADFIDWLIERHELGKDFTFGPQFWGGFGPNPTYEWEYNKKRIDTTIAPGGTGWFLTNKLLNILLDNGGRILYRTAAKRILLDDSGAVSGVLASDPGGEVKITCEKCVVAAGAISRNPELVRQFNPIFYGTPEDEPVHVFTCATCTGDGVIMCREIGADIDYKNARVGMFGPMRHPFGTPSIAAARNHYGVDITRAGDRFYGETDHLLSSDIVPLAYVPGRMLWHVLDERGVERAETEAIGRAPDVPGIDMDRLYRNWKADLQEEASWGTLAIADTLEELAEKMNIPADKLRDAVESFNHDPASPCQIGPEGPFYAVWEKLFHENALGGMVIDAHLRVLKQGIPIPGLYAAGDNTRGIMVDGPIGATYIEPTISALTFAFCSGFAAGQEVTG